jgi:hypothetical protein
LSLLTVFDRNPLLQPPHSSKSTTYELSGTLRLTLATLDPLQQRVWLTTNALHLPPSSPIPSTFNDDERCLYGVVRRPFFLFSTVPLSATPPFI